MWKFVEWNFLNIIIHRNYCPSQLKIFFFRKKKQLSERKMFWNHVIPNLFLISRMAPYFLLVFHFHFVTKTFIFEKPFFETLLTFIALCTTIMKYTNWQMVTLKHVVSPTLRGKENQNFFSSSYTIMTIPKITKFVFF